MSSSTSASSPTSARADLRGLRAPTALRWLVRVRRAVAPLRDLAGQRVGSALAGLLGLAAFIALWKAAHELGWAPRSTLPDPFALPDAFRAELRSGAWGRAVRSSLVHYVWGVGAGTALGVLVGLAAATFRAFDDAHAIVARILRPIPPLAWVFFAIAWFKVSHAGAAFVIAIGVFWINYFAAYAAVDGVDRRLLELARSFGRGALVARIRTIVLPAAAPGILTGVRTGLGQGWMTLIAAELLGVPGMGQEMNGAAGLLQFGPVVVYMLTIAAFYMLSDALFGLAQRRLLRWRCP